MDAPIKTDYRPDIDGLRAIAVLSVIVFHINKHLLPGGFVGVDIFFVISGFLISLHILRDMELGQFSIVEFYRRRVKRIALPLIVVVLAVVVAAQLLMIPDDAKQAADSALYSLASLANVYFWLFQDTSYFAADSGQTPLLHLWTLGVEEQFYILWPLLLLLVYRFVHTKIIFIFAGIAMLASFAFGQVWFQQDPSFVYYMLPSRAGELLMGALLALAVLRGVEKKIPAKTITPMAVAGLLLVAVSLVFLNEDQVFPGVLAILPTLGATLLILSGHCGKNRVSGLLELKPLVAIGLLSYSAYLWHWPLLAFYRYSHAEVGAGAALSIFGLTFALAGMSYWLIERPARASQAPALKLVFMQYLIPAYLIASIALAVIYLDGFDLHWQSIRANFQNTATAEESSSLESAAREPGNASATAVADERAAASVLSLTDPRLVTHYDKPKAAYEFNYVCMPELVTVAATQTERCVLGDNNSTEHPRVILWGDSNASHYIGIVGAIAREEGFRFRNVASYSCPPLADDPAPFVVAKRVESCRSSAVPMLAAVRSADVVIISAAWSYYDQMSDQFFDAFFATVKTLIKEGKQVIIMGKAPEITGFELGCTEKAKRSPIPVSCPFTSPIQDDILSANTKLKAFAEATPNVAYFDVSPYLCKNGMCSAFDEEGDLLYYDVGHLSVEGSWKIGEKILRSGGIPAPFAKIAERVRAGKQ